MAKLIKIKRGIDLMAIRTIRLGDDPILRKKCREVTEFNSRLHQLLDDMAETMYNSRGVGLAAPQVGVLRRVIIIDTDGILIELVNPVIIESSGKQTGAEGCLSFPNEYGTVTRPYKVKVKSYDRSGKEFTITGTELLARALCHEIDHLNGILYKDLATEMVSE